MNSKAKTFLVIGGAGNFGSSVAERLSQNKVIVFDNLSSGKNENIKWGPLVRGQIIDSHLIEKALREYDIETIINTVTDFKGSENHFINRKNEIEGLFSIAKAILNLEKNHINVLWMTNGNNPHKEQLTKLALEFNSNLGLNFKIIFEKDFNPNSSNFDFF